MKRQGWAPSDATVEMGELPSRRSAVRRRGTLSLELTADDILALAINVVQNGWSQEECRPHTGDVPITLPDAVLHHIYAAILMASRRAAAKRMGKIARPRLRPLSAESKRLISVIALETPPTDWTPKARVTGHRVGGLQQLAPRLW